MQFISLSYDFDGLYAKKFLFFLFKQFVEKSYDEISYDEKPYDRKEVMK